MRTTFFALTLLLALASCASLQSVPADPPICRKPGPVDAWILQPARSSLPLLDKLFSISEPASSQPNTSSQPAKTP